MKVRGFYLKRYLLNGDAVFLNEHTGQWQRTLTDECFLPEKDGCLLQAAAFAWHDALVYSGEVDEGVFQP